MIISAGSTCRALPIGDRWEALRCCGDKCAVDVEGAEGMCGRDRRNAESHGNTQYEGVTVFDLVWFTWHCALYYASQYLLFELKICCIHITYVSNRFYYYIIRISGSVLLFFHCISIMNFRCVYISCFTLFENWRSIFVLLYHVRTSPFFFSAHGFITLLSFFVLTFYLFRSLCRSLMMSSIPSEPDCLSPFFFPLRVFHCEARLLGLIFFYPRLFPP